MRQTAHRQSIDTRRCMYKLKILELGRHLLALSKTDLHVSDTHQPSGRNTGAHCDHAELRQAARLDRIAVGADCLV